MNNEEFCRDIRGKIHDKMARHFGIDPEEGTLTQLYMAIAHVVVDILANKKHEFDDVAEDKQAKQVYYMSAEFLVGRSLKNHLYNLGMEECFDEILQEYGYRIDQAYELEPDAGLGNGGLGRLAACYMDGITSQGYGGYGFSIRYEFGIFKQKIVDGWQMEFPDDWLENGHVWLTPKMDETVEVHFDGNITEEWTSEGLVIRHNDYITVLAVPYDMPVSGYRSKAVSNLRLWSAKSPKAIDMEMFSRGEYVKAMEQNAMAESISKILYPADNHYEGKSLRLKQQYFFVCASIQSILHRHMEQYGTLDNLHEKVAIHINDTHPALCIPELMRILVDEHMYSWDKAWEITTRTMAYTNHTVMTEGLETWPIELFSTRLPRIFMIVKEINERFCDSVWRHFPGEWERIARMAIVSHHEVRMSNLCVATCHAVNGVSALHSEIIKDKVFNDFYHIMPDKFTNVTNGIAHRRWLCQSNPLLTDLVRELVGEGFETRPEILRDLKKHADDRGVLDRLAQIKLENKKRLAGYIEEANGIRVDPTSLFDVQVKRLHEYKRQLLNVMHILHLYHEIKENRYDGFHPRTFIFGAKASPGYYAAKEVIRLISEVALMVNRDPVARELLKVVFIEDYKVSLAEIIMPAAEISEQISLAGKEASGTGNMKLMLNGALTVGTLDGANIEILEAVGEENIFIFGMKMEEVEELWRKGYVPMSFYKKDPHLRAVVDMMKNGVNNISFRDLVNGLLIGGTIPADPYMNLADFASYRNIQKIAGSTYASPLDWNKKSLCNIAEAGIFAADRSIREYAENIWDIKPIV
ncbi:MAG: glycogen/starch/alpha-glucan phosphorylase [Clostridia bacterium]